MAKLKDGSRIYGNVTIDARATVTTLNANTLNSATFITTAGLNVTDQANSARDQANTARDQANTARSDANTTFATINTTFGTVNTSLNISYAGSVTNTLDLKIYGAQTWSNIVSTAAYSQANSARDQANTARATANDAYNAANNAQVTVYQNSESAVTTQKINFVNTSTITVSVSNSSGNANVAFTAVGGAAFDQANAAYGQANTARNTANDAYGQANTAYAQANAAYNQANLKLNISGGTITGSLVVQGNLEILGNSTTLNVETLAVEDNEIILNSNVTGGPALDGFITINRGSSTNAVLKWDETADQWKWADGEGTFYAFDAALDAYASANLGYAQANTARGTANDAYAQANAGYGQANTARGTANDAYAQANTGYAQANTARNTANDAYAQANTARTTANDAYAQANSNYQPAVTRLDVTNNGASAYRFDQYGATTDDPTLYVRAGETLAFNLNNAGHPFVIRVSSGGSNYDTGLTHVAANGTVSTGSSAQGKTTGTLYWKVPYELGGNTYVYQCSVHSGMVGNIVIEPSSIIPYAQANAAYAQANAAYGAANTGSTNALNAYGQANTARNTANDAYGQANTARDTANAAYGAANTGSTNALNAYGQANSARSDANTTFATINTTFATLNTSAATQNTNIGNSYDQANTARNIANSSYGQANTATTNAGNAYDQANTARNQANTAYGQANTAYGQANNAYAAANNISTGTTSITLKAYKDFIEANTNVNGANTCDLSISNYFRRVMTASAQFTFTNAPTSGTAQQFSLLILQNATGGYLPTFANTIYWAGGSAPPATTAANARDLWTFITYDGGTTYWGTLTMKDSK